MLVHGRAVYLGDKAESWDDLRPRTRPHVEHVLGEIGPLTLRTLRDCERRMTVSHQIPPWRSPMGRFRRLATVFAASYASRSRDHAGDSHRAPPMEALGDLVSGGVEPDGSLRLARTPGIVAQQTTHRRGQGTPRRSGRIQLVTGGRGRSSPEAVDTRHRRPWTLVTGGREGCGRCPAELPGDQVQHRAPGLASHGHRHVAVAQVARLTDPAGPLPQSGARPGR